MPLSAILVLLLILHIVSLFSNHISNLSRSCFTHIRDLRRIRPMLDSKTSSTIATSIVHSKLDYCNSVSNFSVQIQHLQLIQNSLARAVTRTPRHRHNACPDSLNHFTGEKSQSVSTSKSCP